MRIESVELRRFPLIRVDPAWRTASYAASEVDGFILIIEAGGKFGVGGTAAHPNHIAADPLQRLLESTVRDALLGADALEGNGIRQHFRQIGLDERAFLAADLALYDLIGKLSDLPCDVIWGGRVKSEITVVRMVGIKPLSELEEAVGVLCEQGYQHFKIKIGTTIKEDLGRISMLRRTFGSDIGIGVDGNGAYSVDEAIELSQKLEPFNIKLIEQPIPYDDLDGLARLSANSPISIMADQNVVDAPSAVKVCEKRAAQIISIKATKMGSIDECRKVAEICSGFGVGAHIGGSVAPAIVDMAQAQFAATMQEVSSECEAGEFLAVTGDLVTGATIVDGLIKFTNLPGFGVDVLT